MNLNTFDLHKHCEEVSEFHEYMSQYTSLMDKLDTAFKQAVIQIIDYYIETGNYDLFVAAAKEAYICATEEMHYFMNYIGINSEAEFIIYLNGVKHGVDIT